MIKTMITAGLTMLSAPACAQQLIDCTPNDRKSSITSIWPSPYLSGNRLCFDIQGWPNFAGGNCVSNGGSVAWSGTVLVSMDSDSQGRDFTHFRVVDPVVSESRLTYVIEWSRGGSWKPMQNISISRLTGDAVSYFVTMHGGEPYRCRLKKRAL